MQRNNRWIKDMKIDIDLDFNHRAFGRNCSPITTYAYDPDTGDLTGIDYNDTTPDITLTRDRSGSLVTVTDAAGTRTFTYTDALREASETLTGLISNTLTRQYETQGGAATSDFMSPENNCQCQ